MPTAATYLDLADAFDEIAGDADDVLAPPGSLLTPSVLAGGVLTMQVTDALASCHERTADVGRALRDAAVECRRRAAVCAMHADRVARWEHQRTAYDAALRDWQAADAAHRASPSLPPAGPRPAWPGDRPGKPFDWVD